MVPLSREGYIPNMGRIVRERAADRRRGFILIATAISAIVLLALAGIVIDVGRMYVARSETQAYTDAASIAAALELDGTTAGVTRAVAAAGAVRARWSLDAMAFPAPAVDFATSLAGPWVASPSPAPMYTHARVRSTVGVPMYLLPVLVSQRTGTVKGSSVGAQVPKSTFTSGVFPFSPFAHSSAPPNYGLIPGQDYTLRWANSPKLTGNNVCAGDRTQQMIDIATAQGGSERGFIEETSAANIRATIEDDFQTVTRIVGDTVALTGGAKQTELTSLQNRINQDSDTSSFSYTDYVANGGGNGRRIILAPINDGGTPPGTNNRIVTFGAFFLHRTTDYPTGGGQTWCAEYIGAWVQGSSHQGAGAPGAYVVRLVQ
jgi:Flp pilus assembly protein TadG